MLGAALDQVGGLALARALSLVEMLAVTALLYSLTRRLFNERIGLCAAGFFAVTESAIFLGNFATYDATCLFLLAFAAWIMVRTAAFRWPVFLLAALPAALAVGVKYAGLLFVPTIAVLPVLAGWPERGRRVLLVPAGLRRRRGWPPPRRAAPGRPRVRVGPAEHDHEPRPGHDTGRHDLARIRGVGRGRCSRWPLSAPSPTCGGSAPNRTRRSRQPAVASGARPWAWC